MNTILLIEDNKGILENLSEFLTLEGYQVLTATDGKIGLNLALQFVPDLIVCDVLMPEMNGHEVLQALLQKNKTCEIPFIFSTSRAEKADVRLGLNEGADDYLVKPYEPELLLQLIKSRLKAGSRRQR